MVFGKNNFKNIDLILSNKCNLSCFFCNSIKSNNYSGNKEIVFKSIKKFYESGYSSITFSGGEPTLDKNLLLYISFAKKIGFKKIKIQTNLLFEEIHFKKMIKSGLNSLGFTYFGFEKEKFELITGNKNEYKYLNYIKSLNFIKKSIDTIDISIDIVLNKYIIDNIGRETYKLLRFGFNNLNYKFPFFTGKEKLNYDLNYYSKKLRKYLIGKNFNYNILYIPNCYIKGLENRVYNFSNDYIYDFNYFFSLKDSIDKIYEKQIECKKCKYIDSCFGFEKIYNNSFKPKIYG